MRRSGSLFALRTRAARRMARGAGALCIVFSYFDRAGDERRAIGQRTSSRGMLAQVKPTKSSRLVAYKEQFLLYLDRPTVNFGHRRWLEGPQESYDAAAWLNAQTDVACCWCRKQTQAPAFPRAT